VETRRIGSLQVSVAGLGCNNFGWRINQRETAKVVEAALDSGINFFDTADVYGSGQSEEFLGHALGARRQEVVIATKFGMKLDDKRMGAKPEYVRFAAEESLRRLGTHYMDLYQLHQPDPTVPIADTLAALDELVKAGKVREIGCSNFSAEQIHAAEGAVRQGAARFVSVQDQYSLVHRAPETDVLPLSEMLGLAFLPYFPLANGLLTGKYRRGEKPPRGSRAKDGFGPKVFTDENLATVESLSAFAASRGHTILELAFAWLLTRRVIASVIAGSKTPEQVKANAAAAAGWRLTDTDLREVEAIAKAA